MSSFKRLKILFRIVALFTLFIISRETINAQDYRLSINAIPVISWLSTDIDAVKNEGARAGFVFNVTAEKYLKDNIAITGGLSIMGTGGRLKSSVPVVFKFHSFTSVVAANDPVIYKVQYLSIPVGIKFKTNENNLLSYFAELGFDPKIVIRGRVDIPSIDIKGQRAMTEIKRFNFGYHITGGVDYSINGSTNLTLGIGFENNFFDLTKDVNNQEKDRTTQRIIKFIFGVNFQLF